MSFANYDVEAQKGVSPSVRDSVVEITPIFNDLSSELSEFIAEVTKLDKLQKQLGSRRDNSDLRNQLIELIRSCNSLRSGIDSSLRELEKKDRKVNNPKLSFTEEKLKEQCQEVFRNYRTISRTYNEKIQSVTVNEAFKKNEEDLRQKMVSESTPLLQQKEGKVDASHGSALEEDHSKQRTQIQLQQGQSLTENEVAYHADLINERDEAITNISKGVQDINKIFRDLNEVVNQQGEQIDTIEDSMNDYANNNQMADHELRKADEYQKKKRRWSCFMLLALVIVLLIALALIS
ncbi:DEKNAAC101235 [Brettanomyces naardenensis]|uniref:DEKNAAC101235 n=1 Tax=Brettanomyces naardenensis TaxID=13370 RepID=A0A448YHX9_BRENA|nr:DEKNAAC101235 [Brettanomyces naardenensis]